MSDEVNRESDSARIRLNYYIGGAIYAERYRCHVPRVGDEVRFHKVVYLIVRVVWIEDEPRERVAIDIEPLKLAPAPMGRKPGKKATSIVGILSRSKKPITIRDLHSRLNDGTALSSTHMAVRRLIGNHTVEVGKYETVESGHSAATVRLKRKKK